MLHPMTLGPCEICPGCDGHKRVVCECVTRDPCAPVEDLVGVVGCPACDGDGDHWCPTCMGNGAVTRKLSCTCDDHCDDPCSLCNRPTVKAVRTAYRMGRKDARRYVSRSVGEAHVDSATVERFARILWSTEHGCSTLFEDLGSRMQTKYRMIVQEMLSTIGAVVLRHLDESCDEPVNIEAIARAAEMSIFDIEHEDPCALGHE